MQKLPIDPLLAGIVEQLRAGTNLVLEAPPGAGKTTRVPSALLDSGMGDGLEVWVLEPRRLAARMAARRVAEERGEKPGETVGYQVRFEEIAGPKTRLRFMTEGVLTRRLLSDPRLKKAGIVILDEFHERHMQADIALAMLRRLQQTTRPDLKLVVMSATLNIGPVAQFLGDAPLIKSEGRMFDVSIEYHQRPDERPLAEQVSAAIRRLIEEQIDGDILVFLPGAAEIRRAQEACSNLAQRHDLLLLPLHGELSPADQDTAVRPASKRKVILSTNVSESSVTIDGVVAVIDSGLARIAGHSPWSGLPTLNIARISRASAVQRAGRAGRTRPGRCLRLYTQQDFNARPDHETPEIVREDLAEIALELHASGIADLTAFSWFEAPPHHSLNAAETLLKKLGAIDQRGLITPTGQRMLRFPLHPRQSRLMVEAISRGAGQAAAIIAALIGERDILQSELFKSGRQIAGKTNGPSDLLHRLDLFSEAEKSGFSPSRLRDMGLEAGAVHAVDRVRRQLLRNPEIAKQPAPNQHEIDDALLISVLAGYPDRVAGRRVMKPDNHDLLMSGGGSAVLSPGSVVQKHGFLVAVDAEQRQETAQGKRSGTTVRTASSIKPEWLIDLYPDDLVETTQAVWNAQSERVEIYDRILYDQLIIDERRINSDPGGAGSAVLAEAALAAGLQRFVDPESIDKFIARVDFLRETFPEQEFPEMTDQDVADALRKLCAGLKSFQELKELASRGGIIEVLRGALKPAQSQMLHQMAPEFAAIAGRRQVRVNYQAGKPPWIESRLQDFFGMTQGPMIAGGRVSLVLHLLAPNHRPVQVTTDLAGFWQRTYPQVRKELSRKYPRHSWPENPLIK